MRGRHIWLVPLILAVLVGSVGWWADLQLRRTIQQELHDDLESALEANVTSLQIWMENQKRIAASLADEPRLNAAALELLEQSIEPAPDRAPLGELSREFMIGGRLQERVYALGYDMVQLVSTNLTVVSDAGRRRSRQGNEVLEELKPRYAELFSKAEPIIITPFKLKPRDRFRRPDDGPGDAARLPPSRFDGPPMNAPAPPGGEPPPPREPTFMQVAAPIKDRAGQTRGALALGINPDTEFTRILSVARSGDSGETFAFDAEGLMISQSRFDDQLKQLHLLDSAPEVGSARTLSLRDPGGDVTQGFAVSTNTPRPLIYMVKQAIEGGWGVEIEPFRDYRGVPTVGAWRWLPKYGFGVGTKLDASEAYLPLRWVRQVFQLLFLLLVIASLVILLFSILQVTWRRRLTEAELKARQLGQYQLSEKIGGGGMGVVYKAQHALLRRETAIKLLLPDKAHPEAIARFEQEVRLTCRLTHPNTIQVFDYGHTPDGIFYYAMEYLDGLNLQALVHCYGALPEERVIHILRQICESLIEAHGVGLIHRDLKPANIFVCDRGGVADSVKVLDFGLVKHVSDPAEKPRSNAIPGAHDLEGTPNFIAPEAIKDSSRADARSDLYSLGALGYFLLTGREVFEGDSIAELCRKHLTEEPMAPGARVGKTFEVQLEALLMRCLAKDPAARPQSARELAELLSACPPAASWTTTRRAAWWADHRQSIAGLTRPTLPPDASQIQETVKIEIADRTT